MKANFKNRSMVHVVAVTFTGALRDSALRARSVNVACSSSGCCGGALASSRNPIREAAADTRPLAERAPSLAVLAAATLSPKFLHHRRKSIGPGRLEPHGVSSSSSGMLSDTGSKR